MTLQPQHNDAAIYAKSSLGVIQRPWLSRLSVAIGLALLQACGSMNLPRSEMKVDLDHSTKPPAARTVVDTSDDEVDIELDARAADFFVVRPLDRGQLSGVLSNRRVQNLSFSELGVYDALNLLLAQSGYALSIDGSARGSERYGSSALLNVSGTLKDVLDQVADHAGLFYSVRENTVYLAPDAQFVVDLPPVLGDDSLATVSNSLQFLGARDVYLDRLNRTLVFRTHRKALRGISDYLENLRERRALLVYEVHVYQVDLTDKTTEGISWNGLKWGPMGLPTTTASTSTGSTSGTTSGSTSSTSTTQQLTNLALSKASGSFAMGAVFSGSHFSLDSLLNFLQTQGTVKTLSRPRIAIVSGGKGQMRVGQATTFVSKVGSNLSTSLSQVTVETQTLNTGFELSLQGDVHNGTIYTRIALAISDILRFNEFTALGTQLNLPQTSNRDVRTTVRARPGDIILLGGILIARDSADQNRGISGWLKQGEVARSELVLALKPRVVRFGPGPRTGDRDAPIVRGQMGRTGQTGLVPLNGGPGRNPDEPLPGFEPFSARFDEVPEGASTKGGQP